MGPAWLLSVANREAAGTLIMTIRLYLALDLEISRDILLTYVTFFERTKK